MYLAQYSSCGRNHGRLPSYTLFSYEAEKLHFLQELGQILWANLQLHFNLLHLFLVCFCVPHPSISTHERRKTQQLCTQLLEIVFRLSICLSNLFIPNIIYIHAHGLQVQLTCTASDTEEIKLIHFSKVRRKKIIIFVNERKTKIVLPFLVSASSAPTLSHNNRERQLISAMLHKHSKFTNEPQQLQNEISHKN